MLKLMYITNNPEVAIIAEQYGVNRIFIDMEFIGKEARQDGLNTVKNHHTIDDIKTIRKVIEHSELLVRVNPIHDELSDYFSSEEEVNKAIEAGADVIMLPFFKTTEEVERFIKIVNGRCKTCLLVETPEAVNNLDDILRIKGIDEIYIGLNDLHLGLGMNFMFELLSDGTVDEICNKIKDAGISYGFGGIARIGEGELKSEMIITEHYRLGSSMVILSRSFCDVSIEKDLKKIENMFRIGIGNIRRFEKSLISKDAEFFKKNQIVIKEKVDEIVEIIRTKKDIIISSNELKKITMDALVANGVKKHDAKIISDIYASSDEYGIVTHGVNILPAHIGKIKSGGYNLRPNFKTIRSNVSFSVINGDNSFGPLCAHYCMSLAIENAKKVGIYSVFSNNNNTYGAASYYSRMASNEGLIGITFCNSPAAMAPVGGYEKMIGTNPISVAIPAKNHHPIVLDMATSVVAKSKLKIYADNGQKIPYGLALDKDGYETDDPNKAIQGTILPMSGYKGYGLAVVIDILSGLISGASYLNKVNSFYNSKDKNMGIGFTFVAIDPKQIYGDGFEDEIDLYCETIEHSKAIGDNTITICGYNLSKNYNNSKKNGVRINSALLNKLKEEAYGKNK